MKKRTQRIIVIVLAVALALSVLLPALSMLSGAVTQSDIDNLKDQISANEAQITQVEAKLKEVRDDKAQAAEQKALLEEKIALLNEQISNTEAVIAEYDGLISEKETEIVQLEQQQADQYALFCQQVRDMEEQGSVSYLAIIFSASTFTEMLDNIMMVSEVMEYHNSVIDALRETQEQLEQTKTELEAARAEQEELKAEQEVNKAELLEQEAEVEALIAQISALEADYQEELDRYEAASDQLDDQLAAAEKEYEEQLAALQADNGEWYWPLPGRYYISSSFAPRKHPITGKWSHHTGNDIPAPGGTEIHAAKGGVVTDVGNNSIYGNYIQISHGNGYSTFYGHMRSRAIVNEGDTVTKGQVIGYVGTTGWSTGNHLHLELRINGERADALDLYPNLNFTYSY